MKKNPRPTWGDYNFEFRELPEAGGYDYLHQGISGDLKRVINETPHYSAILDPDGESVMLTFAHSLKFHPYITWHLILGLLISF